ncbi:hypothetical protein HDU81_009634, partial [Chytriomyces hyalinus]
WYQKPIWRDIDFSRPVIVKTIKEQPSRVPTSQTPVPTKWTGRFSVPSGDDSDDNDDLPIKPDSNGFKGITPDFKPSTPNSLRFILVQPITESPSLLHSATRKRLPLVSAFVPANVALTHWKG